MEPIKAVPAKDQIEALKQPYVEPKIVEEATLEDATLIIVSGGGVPV